MSCESWVYVYDPKPVIFFKWKSNENTKQYLTQMLFAINWRYWQTGKKFTHAYDGSRSPHASALHCKPSGFRKKIRVGYFSNRAVKFQLELIYFYNLFFTVVPINSCVFFSCRPFVFNATFSTSLAGSWSFSCWGDRRNFNTLQDPLRISR